MVPHTLVYMSKLVGYYDRLGTSAKAAGMGEQYREVRNGKLAEKYSETTALPRDSVHHSTSKPNC